MRRQKRIRVELALFSLCKNEAYRWIISIDKDSIDLVKLFLNAGTDKAHKS